MRNGRYSNHYCVNINGFLCLLSAEVGDYDPQDHPPGYISQFKMLPKQTQKQEEKIAEFHKKFRYM